MKSCTAPAIVWTRFLGAMLMVSLMVPAAAMSAVSPARVQLGTAGNFVILAKTAISTTGTTQITGDIGVSPVAATYITGFGLIMGVAGTFSGSSLVVGNIYAADYTDPTPSKMTTAIGDMQIAYTDAAGRSLPDYVELYTGDLTGKTLTRGLYNWSTNVLISAAGVTISGTASDIWIFQIAGNLSVADGAMVTLIGGAQASNIFWQVAGQATLGTTAAMKGIILCQTAIVMSTGAALDGRALAQTAVALDANAVLMSGTVNVVEHTSASSDIALSQSFRNQSITFTVPSNARTTLKIMNTAGQEITSLYDGYAEAGKRNQAQFNTTGLATGLYFSRLESNNKVLSAKMLVSR
jgi:hypothetical protein